MPAPGSGTGFQTFVNKEPPPAVVGDFASANPRANAIIGPWAFAASPGGLQVGVIGWANPTTGIASSYFQLASLCGFVHREGQALITPTGAGNTVPAGVASFLAIAGISIVGGDMATVMDQGEFWGLFSSGATAGQKVYTTPLLSGTALAFSLTAAATGGSATATLTAATLTANVLTGTVGSGTIAVGQIVTGGTLPAGTYVISGATTTWTLGNYDGVAIPNNAVSSTYTFYGATETQFYVAQTIAAAVSFTASLATPVAGTAFGILTVTAIVGSGVLVPGQWLSATGGGGLPSTANVQLLNQITGTAGSTGTYYTDNTTYTVTSTATFAASFGQLAKITSWGTTW